MKPPRQRLAVRWALRLLPLALAAGLGRWSEAGVPSDSAPKQPEPKTEKSPTGRDPKLVWTPRQQAVWKRMQADKHPWWDLLIGNADATGTPDERYDDIGSWATLAYQATGDRKYAAKAWAKIEPVITNDPYNANYIREYFIEYALMYDWLYPALTKEQRATYVKGLNRWCEYSLAINTPQYTGGFRTSDSDQTVGQYFGMAFVDLATGPDNPKAGDWLKQSSGETKVGGPEATAADWTTVRNALRVYAEQMAQGGEWFESSEYNLGTLKLLLIGVEGVRTAAGKDCFPEVTRLVPQAALAQLYQLAPDLRDSYLWGDTEHPRELLLFKRVTLLGMLAGLTQDDPEVGPYLNQLVLDLVAKYGAKGYGTAEPWWRLFYFYNPYAPHADWRGKLPPGHYAPGRGLLYLHDGWHAGDSFFGAHVPPFSWEDHDVRFLGDFQLYRKGEWALTHPLGYHPVATSGEGVNGMLLAGLSSTQTARGPAAQEFGPHGKYAYLAGTTGGPFYGEGYFEPPPAFLHEWTRSLFYLPAPDKLCDTVLVFDRVKSDNPQKLERLERYQEAERSAIQAAPALKQWIIHSPVEPTLTAEALTWATPGGQKVRVGTLLPEKQARKVYKEDDLWPEVKYHDGEKKYQTRITPAEERQWDTFLNVVQVHDEGARLASRLVRSDGGEAEGALVQRGGLPDVLVLFGAKPDGRALSAGYKARWTAGRDKTDLYLLDLNPEKKWTARVDGDKGVPVAVSPQGVGRLAVTGKGAHAFELTAE